MGLRDFWRASDRADEFLRTGNTDNSRDLLRDPGDSFLLNDSDNNWVGGAPTGSGGTASCHSSEQCPSGYACINGSCQRMSGGGQQQQPSPGQDCDPDDPNSPCNTGGPGACQQAPKPCGEDGRDCCGTRCCSFGSASSTRPGVHCWCSECSPWPTCSNFCEAYLKSNGEPGPGCAEGRDGNSCDSCTVCDGGECVKNTFNPPCWCEGEGCNAANCYKCNQDPEAFNYGDCDFDSSNCQECGTTMNYLCPCNIILPPITKCRPYGQEVVSPVIFLANAEAERQCEEACKTEDPCKPEETHVVRCTDTGTGYAQCLEGETQTGWVETGGGPEAGGERCVYCQSSDTSNLPDSCNATDCNCHDDCPACQLCGADGKCYPDPECDLQPRFWTYTSISTESVRFYTDPTVCVETGTFTGNDTSPQYSTVPGGAYVDVEARLKTTACGGVYYEIWVQASVDSEPSLLEYKNYNPISGFYGVSTGSISWTVS